jgi:hypothetical protein
MVKEEKVGVMFGATGYSFKKPPVFFSNALRTVVRSERKRRDNDREFEDET